jgi:dTMP kinase
MKRGKLLSIEGTDCSGKETQSGMLLDKFSKSGIGLETISFPRYDTPTGNLIMRYLGKGDFEQEFGPAVEINPRVACTWYAMDRFAAKPEIEEILAKGNHVLLDRYVESNMAHQGGKLKSGEDRGKLFDWIEELEYGNFGLHRPDKTIFLYMPFEVGMELKKGHGEAKDAHEADPDHLRNAERTYLELADRFGWAKVDCAPGGIDGLRTREDIHEEVFDLIKSEI